MCKTSCYAAYKNWLEQKPSRPGVPLFQKRKLELIQARKNRQEPVVLSEIEVVLEQEKEDGEWFRVAIRVYLDD